jgi:hypothetical protein
VKRDSRAKSIIPKIIIFLGTLGVLGIILLFFRARPQFIRFNKKPETAEKLFAQVIEASLPKVTELWEEGDRFIGKEGVRCASEIMLSPKVGRSYYQCQPHLWQCFWEGGVNEDAPYLKIDLFGQTFHVRARASFPAIENYSPNPRFYELMKTEAEGINLKYGMVVELEVKEIPNLSQSLLLTDTCRDTYLPERVYAYGKVKNKKDKGFIWDNFDRDIFLDKFYVSNQQVNEWRLATHEPQKLLLDRKLWGEPAYVNREEQIQYCAFYGKRLLEATLFDAATMSPIDQKNPFPEVINRPETPWQRDITKTFLGVARINPDYQLTPLDCQLAQVEGCSERYYVTDSATWMGIFFGIGFQRESFRNPVEPSKNLKVSSRSLPPSSPWHELATRGQWKGEQNEKDYDHVAFRCYEEVSL